ncbi:MAG TPA: S8 family serine peptidase, partial [Polyangia bacterium]|nr:S8 family serine peptidase [Polyangia bacterium]
MKYAARVIAIAFALFIMPPAHAAWPPPANDSAVDYSDPTNWPNDPDYAGDWNYWSFVPSNLRNQVDAVTRMLGTGMHIDRAWAKTQGDPRVLVAVTDSGIEWNEGQLTNQVFLNPGEAKPPMGCAGADGVKFDVNGDGRFNVLDYTTTTGQKLAAAASACDPRVSDKNNNGVIDPEDIILSFSDGKDDDGNGYVDDISGWDFFHDDNDPMDDTGFGHGTGSSKDGFSMPMDGQGGIGTCPYCTTMMLRVGDAFVPELNTWAMAVTYATDIGASVINISGGGGLDNPQLARDAMDYAYANNVTIIASNSDLDSFHHNYPNTSQHAISVHAIRYDSGTLGAATTFFNYNTCTNYGAQLMLSIPATGCSSEAAGRAGGLAGLLYSAALQAGLPAVDKAGRHLTAEEARQILIGTADNFYDPSDATDPTKYPTAPPQPNGLAFARRFGYGRPNARSAVDAIFAGRLPPEVDIRSPGWFDTIYQDKTPSVMITTHFGWHGGALPAGTTMDWVIEWAPGVDPTDDKYTPIGHAELSTMVGDIAQPWDVSSLTVNNPVPAPSDPNFEPDDPANKYIVTLRARAVLHSSNPLLDGVKGESRHAVSIYNDRDLVAGFPMFLGSSGEGSPKVADLLGDGRREIVFADTSGKVHAIKADGTELAGWPVKTETLPFLDAAHGNHAKAAAFSGTIDPARNTPAGATAAVGDIDGDGKPEVVVATWFGSVWAWHADGSVATGFPVQLDRDTLAVAKDENHELQDGFFASPALV